MEINNCDRNRSVTAEILRGLTEKKLSEIPVEIVFSTLGSLPETSVFPTSPSRTLRLSIQSQYLKAASMAPTFRVFGNVLAFFFFF